ncbi:unnamed protein product [Allacma fusca]|uniref:BPTI/Kunitz inhibitor domain-containing protein n=1 Tax=Allacma fusca TaxID=39272 RepID=A0A8J2LK37_9HEXA|nr:unnamed protein product [Allacma fusca]
MFTISTIFFAFVLILEIRSSLAKGNCSETCLLPPKGGPCLGRKGFRMWYYNFKDGECAKFSYGGCRGNKNKFWSREECEGLCMDKCRAHKKKDRCSLPLDQGTMCENPTVKPSLFWYFNSQPNKCEPFAFSGCGGNENKFESRNECRDICVN